MNNLLIKKLKDTATLPSRSTEGSAGFDLYACLDKDLTVTAGGSVTIPTGIAIGIGNPNYVGYVFSRSGLGIKHGLTLSNSVGVIDSDYTGELIVGLTNHSAKDYIIKHHDRIAQLVIMPIVIPKLKEVENLPITIRSDSGFGSTGR